jgi:hypothetical protein
MDLNNIEKRIIKKLKDFKEGDFLYIMKVNDDPMRIFDCIIKEINITPPGVSCYHTGKFKILLPDGTLRWFYTQLPTISLGKFKIYKTNWNDFRDNENKEEYFICTDRDYLIDEYIKNANLAILLWEDNIKKYQNLINLEKDRMLYLEKQRYDRV